MTKSNQKSRQRRFFVFRAFEFTTPLETFLRVKHNRFNSYQDQMDRHCFAVYLKMFMVMTQVP